MAFARTTTQSFETVLTARSRQAEAAKRDTSPFLKIGTATGWLANLGDGHAPDPGLTVGLTANDLSMHLLVFGGTGSGKTSCIFRPLVKQWTEKGCGGCLVLDGKGQLAKDMSDIIHDFTVIEPETTPYAPISGLRAEEVVDAIVTTAAGDKKGDKDPFWRNSGAALLLRSALVLEHAVMLTQGECEEISWSINDLANTVKFESYRDMLAAVIRSYPDGATEKICDCYRYFEIEFGEMAENTRSGVLATVISWLSPLQSHRDLETWCETAEGVDITAVLRGGRFGLCLPEARFGEAGKMIQALAKLKVYRAAQRRGDSWSNDPEQTTCGLFIDEAQEIFDKADLAVAPVARSLGVSLICGTQTLNQLADKFGADGAASLVPQFRSVLSFAVDSTETKKLLSERAGKALLQKREKQSEVIDLFSAGEAVAASSLWDEHNKTGEYDQLRGVLLTEQVDGVESARNQKTVVGDYSQNQQMPGTRVMGSSISYEMRSIVEDDELSSQLANPRRVLALLHRAGAPRRDYVDCEPIYQMKK